MQSPTLLENVRGMSKEVNLGEGDFILILKEVFKGNGQKPLATWQGRAKTFGNGGRWFLGGLIHIPNQLG